MVRCSRAEAGSAMATRDPEGVEGNPYAGVLFYQDRLVTPFRGPTLIVNFFQGGAAMDLKGAIYFPGQNITYTGGADSDDGCTQLITRGVIFSGTAKRGLQ